MRMCPNCNKPTFFFENAQHPGVPFGLPVRNLPDDLEKLYEEARRCTSATAYTAAVLACRKILMHIAVERKAPEGQPFITYVEYLSDKGYVPPDGKGWVDHIRRKSNEANHEIVLMKEADAQDLVTFVETLFRFIYEFPSRVPKPPPKTP